MRLAGRVKVGPEIKAASIEEPTDAESLVGTEEPTNVKEPVGTEKPITIEELIIIYHKY